LIALLVWAAVEDARARRVPNWITFSLILGGLLVPVLPWAHLRLQQALAGCGVGFGIGMILYLFRAIGAGDVKLLAAVGTWLGTRPVLIVFALAAVIGMVIALVFSARQGRLRTVLRNGVLLGASLAQGPAAVAGASGFDVAETTASRGGRQRGLPFAVAIAASTVAVLLISALMSGR